MGWWNFMLKRNSLELTTSGTSRPTSIAKELRNVYGGAANRNLRNVVPVRCTSKTVPKPFSSDVSRLVPLVDHVWLITYPQIFGHALSMCMYFMCRPSMSNPRQPMDLSVGATKRDNP